MTTHRIIMIKMKLMKFRKLTKIMMKKTRTTRRPMMPQSLHRN
jgi:hypothetical protein